MRNEKRGGLSGKARRIRERSRASRLNAREVIAECLEPTESASMRLDHPVRIGRRSEFFPTAESASQPLVEPLGVPEGVAAVGMQLELPLAPPVRRSIADGAPVEVPGEPVVPRTDQQAPKAGAIQFGSSTSAAEPERAPRTRADTNMFSLHRSAKPKAPFSVGRFLYGCLLGGATAIALLLVVQLVIG